MTNISSGANRGELRWALAAHFPWLEIALLEALSRSFQGPSAVDVERSGANFTSDGRLESWRAGNVLREFRNGLQRLQPFAPVSSGWEQLGDGLWERAEWITTDSLVRLLGPAPVQTAVVRDLDTTEEQFAKPFLRAIGDWGARGR